MESIAVLGAGGMMGRPIATNLARAGFQVRAWNRTREKAEPLSQEGAAVFDTPRVAVEGAGVILTMLTDPDAVLATMTGDDGALAGAGDAAVWLQMSTIGFDGTQRCIELAREHGMSLVDAPVLGTTGPAAAGELIVLASGPDEVQPRLDPIFDVIGSRALWLGEAGAGSKLKLVTNAWLVAVVEGAAESIALAEAQGLDPQSFFDAVSGGPLDLPYLDMKGKAMIERNFEPSFRLALAAKDARLAAEAARSLHLELPMLEASSERMQASIAEHGDEDVAAVFLSRRPAGAEAQR